MTVLITGSSGFIGTNLSIFFKKKKIKFLGVDKNKNKYLKFKELKTLDLLEYNILEKFIKNNRIKYIIHLAAIPGFVKCYNNPDDAFKNNVNATFNLMILAKKYNVKKFILASSMGVDNFKRNPSMYGLTKYICELTAKTFQSNYAQNIVVLKLSNVFGPYSLHKTSVVHEFIKNIILKKKIKIHKTGTQQRDFIYVKDVCRKIYSVLNNSKNTKVNINTNKYLSIINLKKILDSICGKYNDFDFVRTPQGYDDKNYNKPNITYHSKLKNNLKKTFDWYTDHME